MVCFKDQKIASRKRMPDLSGGTAQVRRHADLEPGLNLSDGDSDRIGGIVDREERLHDQGSDRERKPGSVGPDLLLTLEKAPAGCPGGFRQVQGGSEAPSEYAHPTGMISVIVRDHHCHDVFGPNTYGPQPAFEISGTEPGVDKNPGFTGFHEDSVSLTSAPQDGNPHSGERRSSRVISHARRSTPTIPSESITSRLARAFAATSKNLSRRYSPS